MAKVSIERAKELFDEWRKERRGRAPAPENLRRIALGIKALRGERIAREELGLSSATLWNWSRAEAGKRPGPVHGSRKPAPRTGRHKATALPRVEFVELTQPPGQSRMNESLTISFERVDGARMKLSGVFESSQIERLAGRFLAGELSR